MKGVFELDEIANAPEKENLMVVDCLNLSFRYLHRGQTDFAGDYLRTISSLAKSYGAKTVILLSDKGKSSFRLEIRPEYKSGRKKKQEEQSEEEKQKFIEFFEGYERALELSEKQYPLVRMNKVEADDTAAYIVKHYSQFYNHTWLISSDADWDLLLTDTVSRFSFVTRKEYHVTDFYEHHGCDNPEQFVCVKALQGDTGDTIEGIKGVGVKRAYNLVREHGSALDLIEALPLPATKKVNSYINESEQLIMENIMLVDLLSFCEDAIAHPDSNNLQVLKEFCDDKVRC